VQGRLITKNHHPRRCLEWRIFMLVGHMHTTKVRLCSVDLFFSFVSLGLEINTSPFKNWLCPPVFISFNFGLHSFYFNLFCFWCFLRFELFSNFFPKHFISFNFFIQFDPYSFDFFVFYSFMIFFISSHIILFFYSILVLVLLISIFLFFSWFIIFFSFFSQCFILLNFFYPILVLIFLIAIFFNPFLNLFYFKI
jgi:hypothetical protein